MTTMQIGRCLRQFLGLLQHNGFSTDIADLAYELSTDSQNLLRSNDDLTPGYVVLQENSRRPIGRPAK